MKVKWLKGWQSTGMPVVGTAGPGLAGQGWGYSEHPHHAGTLPLASRH